MKVSDYIPEWRRFEETPKPAIPIPEQEVKAEPSPPASQPADTAGDVPEQEAPDRSQPESEKIIRQEYDYGLLDMELDDLPSQTPDMEKRYGAFDLIETPPDEVGRP